MNSPIPPRMHRRQALSGIGTIALASLLQDDGLLAAHAHRPQQPDFPPRAKACIFISLCGGASQIDMFDPKPQLTKLHGSPLPESMIDEKMRFAFLEKKSATLMATKRKFAKHGQCGMEISELLPHLAGCVDDICLVRSMQTDSFNHHPGELLLNTGSTEFGRPSTGAWLNYGLGSTASDLPGYVVFTAGAYSFAGAQNWSNGFLPANYQGVMFRNGGEPVLDLNSPPAVTPPVQQNTRAAINALNRQRLQATPTPELTATIKSYELAFRMQSRIPELVDLSDESQATLDAYGFGRDIPNTKNWIGGGPDTFEHLSRNCLMARRLVERGVRFVHVAHSNWDLHQKLDDNMDLNCYAVDQPIAALLKDLKQRGMLDETLVVCASEFGRTPLGENRRGTTNITGRDHHPLAYSIWLAGGGVRGGQVVGQTDEFGWNVVKDHVHVHDLHATILHLFGLDHERLTFRFRGRDMKLTDIGGTVVDKMLRNV